MEKLEIKAKPNWLELPRDITINIIERVGTTDIVISASVVCTLWWNICKDPLLWRTIDMITDNCDLSYCGDLYSYALTKICYYAVHRSCGHLKDIYIKTIGTDDLLLHIANSASKLRCIRLQRCPVISNEAFEEIAKKQPFLEELDIDRCYDLRTDFFEYIGKCCPLLKSLKFNPCIEKVYDKKYDDVALVIARSMSNLRHLTILNNPLTNNGLLAILDGCPLLVSLDIRGCIYVDLDAMAARHSEEAIACNTRVGSCNDGNGCFVTIKRYSRIKHSR